MKMIAAIALAAMIAAAPAHNKDSPKKEEWKSLGKYRITVYCEHCNEPQGRESASGKRLRYGLVAMNGVPFGTLVSIDGEIFEVVDRCGPENTVDIFVENDDGYCTCDFLEFKEVRIKQ